MNNYLRVRRGNGLSREPDSILIICIFKTSFFFIHLQNIIKIKVNPKNIEKIRKLSGKKHLKMQKLPKELKILILLS